MSWSKYATCSSCQCEYSLEPMGEGWIGTCPNCGITHLLGDVSVPEEPEPVDCHILVCRQEGIPTWKYTNLARMHKYFDSPNVHLKLQRTPETKEMCGETFEMWLAIPTPVCAVRIGECLYEFCNSPQMYRWAERGYHTLTEPVTERIDGKDIHVYGVVE